MTLLLFFAAFVVGGTLGVIVMALFVAAKRRDIAWDRALEEGERWQV